MFLPPYGSIYGGYGYDRYGPPRTLRLSVTSPPQAFTAEPITVDEAAAFLVLDTPLSDEDTAELSLMISAAREWAEGIHNRELVVKSWDLAMDFWPAWQVELKSRLIGVDLVQYRDSTGAFTTLTPDTDYIVDTMKEPGLLMPPYTHVWPSFTPWPTSAILVRFRAGMTNDDPFWTGADGARIKIGMRQLITLWYTRRLPFERRDSGNSLIPYEVTACLSFGRRETLY